MAENGTNGTRATIAQREEDDPRLKVLHAAERAHVYQRGRRPFSDDPIAATITPFHDPNEEATMAHLTPAEGAALAYMRTVGRITRNPLIVGYARDFALFTRSRGGSGSEQVASVLRAGQGEKQKLSLRERLFGRAPEQQQPPQG